MIYFKKNQGRWGNDLWGGFALDKIVREKFEEETLGLRLKEQG